ncbi:MAG: cysteine--tRNA ligase [Anaerolineaceae bacterium 4572_32.1]|nr:MAG: cysteine--tRNA ligase [Anaerolineaceae bacterium 4572_32.1]
MTLQVYNYLTRQKEEFVPLHKDRVRMYVCGPTIYDHAHVGHAKAYISFDVVARYLRYLGYDVRYVQNITDVGHLTDNADAGEDKILRRAAEREIEPMELVETYMRSYFEDMDALGIVRPNISPRPSGHITEQIEMIQTLLDKGYAYEANASVYFEVAKFPEYGKLSGRKVEEQQEGARVGVNPDKRHPADFALWKKAEPGHIMRWPSPWGWGYPGWHIECSVMSIKYLGQTFDIHGGGLENIFPHNECEIAQAEAATGQPFARYWLLNNMVTVDGIKMGKSLGNSITIKDALSEYDPLVLRFFVLSSHYRSPTDFSDTALEGASKGLDRLLGTVRGVRERLKAAPDGELDSDMAALLESHKRRFLEAMDDDFNAPQSIGVLFDLAREVNRRLNEGQALSRASLQAVDALYRELGGEVLGLIPDVMPQQSDAGLEADLMRLLIEMRQEAREAKNWAQADAIRDRLAELGVVMEDGPQGTTWRKVR